MTEIKKSEEPQIALTHDIVKQNEKILEMNLLIIKVLSTPTIIIGRKEKNR